MQFRITTEWLDHTTKFYQLFRIERMEGDGHFRGRAATVGHYGPHSAVRGSSSSARRPIMGGQCVVYPGEKHRTLRDEKVRKGYRADAAPGLEDLKTEELFRRWLTENMPTKAREQILTHLSLTLDPGAEPIDPDDQPIARAETISSEPEERPEGWGDW